jgi:hypothetical protein
LVIIVDRFKSVHRSFIIGGALKKKKTKKKNKGKGEVGGGGKDDLQQ